MNIYSKILLLLKILLLNQLECSKAARLKLRIHHEMANPTRKMQVDLETKYSKGGEAFGNYRRNLKNGKNFQIRLKSKDERSRYQLCFHVYISPIDGEFVPDESGDADPSDDQPYGEETNNIEMDDIRTMFRCIEIKIFAPSLSKRFVINLGSVEPKHILWNRRIIMNNSANDDHHDHHLLNNYHAFLYAKVNENRRDDSNSDAKKLLGFASLIKIIDQNESSSSISQHKQLSSDSEFFVSIPINLTSFFKHKIWYNELRIYRYEETKYLIESQCEKNSQISADQTPTAADAMCSICLEPIIKEQNIIKLHGENGDKSAHMFHNECIKKWFIVHEKFRCPLCNKDLKIELMASIPAIFVSNADTYSTLYMSPLVELFRIAEAAADENRFEQKQAQYEINEMLLNLKESEQQLKELLTELNLNEQIVLNLDQKLIEMKDKKIVENPSIELIQKELEKIVNNHQQQHEPEIVEKAEEALEIIDSFKSDQIFGNIALANLNQITVAKKKKKSKFVALFRD